LLHFAYICNQILSDETIYNTLIPRLKANIGAGRKDSVISMARFLADHYEQALDDAEPNDDLTMMCIHVN